MCLRPLLPLLLLVLLGATIGRVNADLHRFGTKTNTRLELAKQLYNASVPDATARNYTVVFKLRDAADESHVSCVELFVPGINTSALVGDVQYDRSSKHTMEVTLSVPNARNLSIHLSVYTTKFVNDNTKFLLDREAEIRKRLFLKKIKTDWIVKRKWTTVKSRLQSFTMVHVQRPPPPCVEPRLTTTAMETATTTNATETTTTATATSNVTETTMSGPYNAVGRRQPGDRLVHFRTMMVTNLNNFPSREISFEGNERLAITYVGFTFDSPTAVAFVNSSHTGERQVNAIVYDMSEPAFIANMSVFGYEWSWFEQKPVNYQPILRLGYTASRQHEDVEEMTTVMPTANATLSDDDYFDYDGTTTVKTTANLKLFTRRQRNGDINNDYAYDYDYDYDETTTVKTTANATETATPNAVDTTTETTTTPATATGMATEKMTSTETETTTAATSVVDSHSIPI